MSVYVSPFEGGAGEGRYLLFGDSDEGVHAFARELGLKRKWASDQSPITYEITTFRTTESNRRGRKRTLP